MKRFALALLLSVFAACEDDPNQPPTELDACEALDPSAAFSWSVDPVLDTLITYTVHVDAPPCSTAYAWFKYRTNVTIRNDEGQWFDAGGGRIKASSTLTRDDWGVADTLYVTWGLHPEEDAEIPCFGDVECVHYDTLTVRAVLP
jgi:hypothetical protein